MLLYITYKQRLNQGKDATRLSNMIIARFRDGRNLIREGKIFIKDESKLASRVSGVK